MSGNVERDLWEVSHLVSLARLKLVALIDADTRMELPQGAFVARNALAGAEVNLGQAAQTVRDISPEGEPYRSAGVRNEVETDLMLGRIRFWRHTLIEVGE